MNSVGATIDKVLFAWSGGKDSAMALYELRKDQRVKISALLTTVTKDYDRISMHGVRTSLLEEQAASIGLPLKKVYITKSSSNSEYEDAMREALESCKKDGLSSVAFGDIFLEDLRRYREDKLSEVGMRAVFPIWRRDTRELANTFMDLGFKAIITCVDTHLLAKEFSGRLFDRALLADLPANVDPCGENGEFHSFVFDGPIFNRAIQFKKGETVLRDNRFCYCDLL